MTGPPDAHAAAPLDAIRAICPYLLAAGGGWRAARPLREHRCHAVQPAAFLTNDQQRGLCLAVAHETCPRYAHALGLEQAALEAVGVDAQRLAGRRMVALTRPIPTALERPSAVPGPAVLTARARRIAEVGLVVVMFLAAALLILARFGGFGLIGAP